MKQKIFRFLKIIFFSLLAYSPLLFTHSIGPLLGLGPWETVIDILILLTIAGMALIFILGVAFTFFKNRRSVGKTLLFYCLSIALLFIPIMLFSSHLRMQAFHMTGLRAKPLIAAIESYQQDHSAPPALTQDLIPQYLQQMPYGLPEFEILNEGNIWVLKADVGVGLLNWDEFYYRSDKKYDDLDSNHKRLGDWIYYYE